MQNKDLTKRKNDLMKSILGNPKLSKAFKDAMGAPIGSTKREQAKSILSIMKKLSGVHYDGMGGPGPSNNQSIQTSSLPDYSNMMIFPAAPKFKIKAPNNVDTKTATNDGQGGPYDSLFSTPYTSSVGTGKITAPSSPVPGGAMASSLWNAIVNPKPTGQSLTGGATSTPLFGGAFSNYQAPDPLTKAGQFLGIPKVNWPTLSKPGTAPLTSPNWTPIPQSMIPGADTGKIQSTISDIVEKQTPTPTPTTTGVTTGASATGTGTPPTQAAPTQPTERPMSEGEKIKAAAQQAVDESTGAGLFAMGVADEKFGGSLSQYINNLDKKLKVDFNLDNLETELSNLKAQKNNLVPTLTQYIQGKDKYLKFVDEMIDKTEGTLLQQDLGNPAVANSYNNYLNYLYTLKGRQSQRYGNFLNSAISDYNADLENTQSNYESVYSKYNDAITRQGTIAQNEYNTLYQTMGDLYNNLEQAPIKRANLEALQLQNYANQLTIADILLKQGQTTNPDFLKDVKEYGDFISDKDGNFSDEAVGAGGLAGLFASINYQGGDPQALAKAINTAMATSIKNSGGDATKRALELKTLVDDLSSIDGGEQLAAMITPSLSKAAYPIVNEYVLNNLDTIKTATAQLVGGKTRLFGLANKKSGLTDKEGWMKDFQNLDKGILDSLYETTKLNIVPGSVYEQNPSAYVSALFPGGDDTNTANNLTSVLLSSW